MGANAVGIFVMSCDKTADVADHFVSAFCKYWPQCPYPVYFGVNTFLSHIKLINAIPLEADINDWRHETLDQLDRLREHNPHVTHVLVFLDDFILNKYVETDRVSGIVDEASRLDISYLRLKPLEESIWGRIRQHFLPKTTIGGERCFKIRRDHPYYSSLQVSLWNLEHLRNMVGKCQNIWSFENQVGRSKTHYSVFQHLFRYKHIVEKGSWDLGAEEYCKNAIGWFEKGSRPMKKGGRLHLHKVIRHISFTMLGYSMSRIKRSICQISKR